ncbi:hypothetical protein MGYG_07030 [Nannizzia gypsea CBS 118893]|uniref:Uncharacterized protein n=1 Tax=Arthroderma gypseum (strain ATCC MYA-4604 / CBS 118893) TaxID=535722 RepID=E4V1W0_ARTGP|nr:hypothetical protein MGYG_07030 [Nannizzia gypsea CBS 118893]EFR04025.1 hypothetical protein MGYG_07030 [Nannizzia gypsea CBS 118893]
MRDKSSSMVSQIFNNRCSQLLTLAVCFYAANVSASNYSSIVDIWPDMANLSAEPRQPGVSYITGGLSLFHCCKIALNASVQIEDGRLSFVPGQTFLHGDPQVFAGYPNPCNGPPYTGYEASVPQGTISYSWCAERCPGWQRIDLHDVKAWVQQMLSYTLPAAIFSTNIPRRRQLRIPSQYFPRLTFLSFLSLAYKLPIATFLATVDVVLWLVVVFCLSGPMMLSGLYGSLLDHKVLRQLATNSTLRSLTFKQRCHLTMILPLGSLDQKPAWEASVSVVKRLPDLTAVATDRDRLVGRKIRMLLQTQQMFGSALGIGVLFFISAFIYACLELQDNLGGSYVYHEQLTSAEGVFSHNLAFGIFWMVIPHVAIIANMTLMSSDLTSWDLVALEHVPESHQVDPQLRKGEGIWHRVLRHFGLCSRDTSALSYKVAWQWDQGRCKMGWVERYIEEYPRLGRSLRTQLRISSLEMVCSIWLPALFILLVPSALGCLIRYVSVFATTPLVGIGCKSIIPIVYLAAQFCGVLRVFYVLFAFAAGVASVGGTIAVDLGMTNNCLCLIPVSVHLMSQWMKRFDPSAVTFLSSNVNEGKYYASQFWLNCGIATAAFLFAMMYLGWWWSRSLWTQFYALCDEISGSLEKIAAQKIRTVFKGYRIPTTEIHQRPPSPSYCGNFLHASQTARYRDWETALGRSAFILVPNYPDGAFFLATGLDILRLCQLRNLLPRLVAAIVGGLVDYRSRCHSRYQGSIYIYSLALTIKQTDHHCSAQEIN